jgi:hypothetical protein
VAGFPDQVNDCPVILTLLNIAKTQGNDFRSPQSTAEEKRDYRGVTLLPKCLSTRPGKELFGLCGAEPIADAAPELRYSFHSPDTGHQFWAQQPGIGRFVSQAAHCGEPDVDC